MMMVRGLAGRGPGKLEEVHGDRGPGTPLL